MEATIKEPNIKHFVRLLQCAARYGDELCMHATKDSWDLSVTNTSKSAFCLFTLLPSFFFRYKALGTAEQRRRGVKCKLYVKSVIGVLGKASSVNAVESVLLKITDPEGGLRVARGGDESEEEDDVRTAERSAQLEIKLVYHHGITKKHVLHLQSSDFLRAIIDTNSAPCGFQTSARLLREWIDHFNIAFTSSTAPNGTVKADSQLAWRFAPTEIRVKNFENLNISALMTEIRISVDEFNDYEIEAEDGCVDLALPMREFKATLQLAEQLNMDLDFFFSEATQPLAMSSRFHGLDRDNNEKQLFTIFCVIATTSCTAFADAPAANGEVADRSRSRSSSMSIKADSEASARKRRPEGGLRAGARPRASLTMTAQPPSRGPSTVTVVMNDRTWSQRLGSQAHAAGEPLFLPGGSQAPGGSQTVRMTQEEVLELAGLDTGDLDAMVDDMDAEDMEAEDEQSKAAEEEEEKDTPADWSEVSDFTFGGLGPSDMSTPHDAVAAAAAAPASAAAEEEENPESPPRKSPHLHGRTESVRDIRTREPTRPLARAPSARAAETSWEPDEDIFGPGVGGAPSGAQKSPTQRTATQRSATQRSATQQTSTQRTTPKPSTPVSTLSARPLPSPTQKNEVDDDEEFESDNEANPSYPNLFQD